MAVFLRRNEVISALSHIARLPAYDAVEAYARWFDMRSYSTHLDAWVAAREPLAPLAALFTWRARMDDLRDQVVLRAPERYDEFIRVGIDPDIGIFNLECERFMRQLRRETPFTTPGDPTPRLWDWNTFLNYGGPGLPPRPHGVPRVSQLYDSLKANRWMVYF